MRITRRLAAVLLLSAAPAFAQDGAQPAPEPAAAGTAEGARSLADGLAPYLGRGIFDNGTLKVEPDPAGYRLTFDPKSLLEPLKAQGTDIAISSYSAVVSQRPDGNWNYFTNAPIDIAVHGTTNGVRQDIDYAIGPQAFKGVFSPDIAAFVSGSGTIEKLVMKATQPDSDISASTGRMNFDLSGAPAGGGAADIAMRQAIEAFHETVAIKGGPDVPPGGVSFDVKAAKADTDFGLKAARSRQLIDLYSFFVAHPEYFAATPDRAKLAASQNDLKAKLRDALPFWSKLDSAYVLSNIEIGSQYGSAKANSFRIGLTSDGVSKAGSFGYSFGFAGLDLSAPAIPSWAMSLIPSEMDLRFRMDNLDLQTPADILLADFDLSRVDPVSEAAQQRIEATFTENPPRFVIEPSRIKSQDLELAMTGSFAVGAGKPAATIDLTATGLEKTIATLQTAAQSQPEINQVIGGLSMAKGFGKTLPDGRVQWVVDAASDGSVKVNGFEIKGPDPVIAPPSDDGTSDEPDEGIAPDGEVPMDQAPTDDNALPETAPQP